MPHHCCELMFMFASNNLHLSVDKSPCILNFRKKINIQKSNQKMIHVFNAKLAGTTKSKVKQSAQKHFYTTIQRVFTFILPIILLFMYSVFGGAVFYWIESGSPVFAVNNLIKLSKFDILLLFSRPQTTSAHQ